MGKKRDNPIDSALRRRLASAPATGESCPDDSRMAAYLERRLAPLDASSLEAHASRCGLCQEVLALALRLEEEPAIAAAAGGQEAPQPVRRSFWVPLSAAGLALLALGIAVILVREIPKSAVDQVAESGTDRNRSAPVAAVPAGASTAPAAAAVPAPPPADQRANERLAARDLDARSEVTAGAREARAPRRDRFARPPAELEADRNKAAVSSGEPAAAPPAPGAPVPAPAPAVREAAPAAPSVASGKEKADQPVERPLPINERAPVDEELQKKAELKDALQDKRQIKAAPVATMTVGGVAGGSARAQLSARPAPRDAIAGLVAQVGQYVLAKQRLEQQEQRSQSAPSQAANQKARGPSAQNAAPQNAVVQNIPTQTPAAEGVKVDASADAQGRRYTLPEERVAGRTFHLYVGYWIDAEVVRNSSAQIVELRPGAEEYDDVRTALPGLDALARPSPLNSAAATVIVHWKGKNFVLR